MSDLLTERDLKTERATEPPKRWRNWWLVTDEDGVIWCDGEREYDYECGDVVPSKWTWPSREVAEQKAREADAAELREHGFLNSEWLGAFPDGEAP